MQDSTVNISSKDLRLQHEIEHGRRIATHAEEIWNWSSPAGRQRAERRAKYLYGLGNFISSSRLLEIGCGTGLFTEKIWQATGAHITAVDVSQELLEQARQKLPQVDFVCGDAMALKFPDESFDGAYGSSVLHHLDIDAAYREIFRVLKKDGSMVFAEPNMLNPQIFLERHIAFLKKRLGVSPDETAMNRWKTKARLLKTGFRNVRIFPYDFLHPATPEFLIPAINRIGWLIEKIPLLREIAGSVIVYAEK